MTAVPHTHAAADGIYYQEENENNDALESAIDNLSGSNLIAFAGIVSTQLRDRYAISRLVIPLIPPAYGADWDPIPAGITGAASFIQALLLCAELAYRARPRGDRPGYGDPRPASRYGGRPSPAQ